MQNFILGFIVGSLLVLIGTVGWYHFALKAWFDEIKRHVTDEIKAKL